MKILGIGISDSLLCSLRRDDTLIERQRIHTTLELFEWLANGYYEALLIDLDFAPAALLLAPQSLRKEGNPIPIVGVVSSTGNPAEWSMRRALFLEAGGDDLVPNTAGIREVMASLSAALRRVEGRRLSDVVVCKAGSTTLTVNLGERSVYLNKQEVSLSGSEFCILKALASQPGVMVHRHRLYFRLETESGCEEPSEKIVDVFVSKMRRKLNNAAPHRGGLFIETCWGEGYRLRREIPLSLVRRHAA